ETVRGVSLRGPRTSTEDWERNTVSEGAKPVTDSAAVRGADEHPQSRSARRPALAEVAAATRGPRRFVSRIGAIVPASFILITIAVPSSLGQPLRGGVEVAVLIVWAAFTLMLLTPLIAAALAMLTARRGGTRHGPRPPRRIGLDHDPGLRGPVGAARRRRRRPGAGHGLPECLAQPRRGPHGGGGAPGAGLCRSGLPRPHRLRIRPPVNA